MRNILLAVAVAGTIMSCNSAADNSSEQSEDSSSMAAPGENTLTDQEKAEGWTLLFDGQTMNGWHTYGRNGVGKAWQVADGAIVLDTGAKKDFQTLEGGDICTNDEFENFDLKLQWKISPGGNSGIIFYVQEDTSKFHYTFESGPEMQVLDNEGHEDGKIEKHHAGDLYDLIASTKPSAKPVGDWNDVEIKSLNGKLDMYLNGENVVSTTMWDDNWKKLIAGSKFKDMPGFGTFRKGKIALQDHGFMVYFRNIKIRKL
jgi:3-keto-disaccharide hydrolase